RRASTCSTFALADSRGSFQRRGRIFEAPFFERATAWRSGRAFDVLTPIGHWRRGQLAGAQRSRTTREEPETLLSHGRGTQSRRERDLSADEPARRRY